ncbi:MAG: NADP-dependent malic enzyme [Candidatus Eisenbacteria bacterium]|nr:NADP-dependent malic enzyme [Candidatus Eisenbacteria bacterium]
MIEREDSLAYHAQGRPGKIELRPTKPCLSPRELRLAYLPGASFPSEEIARERGLAFRYTSRGNLVGVISNGSAVPGLGDVGPEAAKPMLEGMAVLFKRLADIDVFDLELDTSDPDRFIETVRLCAPTFGGINLKDIRAPEGLYIYDKLSESLDIPVFHENLYSNAVVAVAALRNALDLVEKRVDGVRVVICGAGTVGTGCARLLLRLGVLPENLLVYDERGLIRPDRKDLHDYQRAYAREDTARDLAAGLDGADVFVGASAAGVLDQDMIRSMNRFPVVFALATPEPEIGYEEARASRRDLIFATALDSHPNAVVDLLSFPYIFRGALDVQATRITEGMMLAAAGALADLAREDVVEEVERAYGRERFSFGPEYLLPKLIDPRVLVRESAAVARCAVEEGVARLPVEMEAYQESLTVRFGTGRETLRGLMMRARRSGRRVVFTDGADEAVLRACAILTDEGIVRPILLGREEEVRAAAERVRVDLGGARVIDPAKSGRADAYAEAYFAMRGRRGVVRAVAERRVAREEIFAAMMLHGGDADLMMVGSPPGADPLQAIREVIGPAEAIRKISGLHVVLLPKRIWFLADCAVNPDPTAEDLAETALLAARTARSLGVEPAVALLSLSNFGAVDHESARRARRAAEIAKERAPGLALDGEMQLAVAVDGRLRREQFPFSTLEGDANVLVFPDLQSGRLALHLLQHLGDAVSIGPLLLGTRLPAHILPERPTVEDVVNLTTLAVVEAMGETAGE